MACICVPEAERFLFQRLVIPGGERFGAFVSFFDSSPHLHRHITGVMLRRWSSADADSDRQDTVARLLDTITAAHEGLEDLFIDDTNFPESRVHDINFPPRVFRRLRVRRSVYRDSDIVTLLACSLSLEDVNIGSPDCRCLSYSNNRECTFYSPNLQTFTYSAEGSRRKLINSFLFKAYMNIALKHIKNLHIRYDEECEMNVCRLLVSVRISVQTLLLVSAYGPGRPMTPSLMDFSQLRRLGVTVAEECLHLISNWIRYSSSNTLLELQLSIGTRLPVNGWDRWSHLDSTFTLSKCTRLKHLNLRFLPRIPAFDVQRRHFNAYSNQLEHYMPYSKRNIQVKTAMISRTTGGLQREDLFNTYMSF
ncbi:uncharacterized protein ARMOST_17377 [Armillaria ostoyae]|uniref:F-box domain-containing protein n=1 Tax=Armillaria ostoyae TaxID=47428 RepID=A0A284RYZ8_ARMOS|nr:uncharacterized protein ARMOST_17377 [Armillaria ostoyae]